MWKRALRRLFSFRIGLRGRDDAGDVVAAAFVELHPGDDVFSDPGKLGEVVPHGVAQGGMVDALVQDGGGHGLVCDRVKGIAASKDFIGIKAALKPGHYLCVH